MLITTPAINQRTGLCSRALLLISSVEVHERRGLFESLFLVFLSLSVRFQTHFYTAASNKVYYSSASLNHCGRGGKMCLTLLNEAFFLSYIYTRDVQHYPGAVCRPVSPLTSCSLIMSPIR